MSNSVIAIDLPWPPMGLSPNARMDRRAATSIRQQFNADCWRRVLVLNVGKISGRHAVTLVFHPPDNRRRDLDNLLARMKYGLDGVAKALGIDDREFDPITISLGAPGKVPFVSLKIIRAST